MNQGFRAMAGMENTLCPQQTTAQLQDGTNTIPITAMAGKENMAPCPQRTITQFSNGRDSLIDVTVWDKLAPHIREGDIVVNTFMKSGTTWMAQVILQMINNGEETLFAPDNTLGNAAPWIENKLAFPNGEGLAKYRATPAHHRRVVKSHLQLDALLFSPKIRYVCVFRDGRDVVMSSYNHRKNRSEKARKAASDVDLDSFDNFFDNWIHHGNWPSWTDYFHHLQSWWQYANSCDNILIINYNEMKRNLANVVLKLAKFNDIRVDETSTSFQNILRHSSFQYMKQHEDLFEPLAHILVPGNFINKGVSGRWRDVLSESQQQMYWDKVTQCWSPELIEFVHKDYSNGS